MAEKQDLMDAAKQAVWAEWQELDKKLIEKWAPKLAEDEDSSKAYDPTQPRYPKGHAMGGRWMPKDGDVVSDSEYHIPGVAPEGSIRELGGTVTPEAMSWYAIDPDSMDKVERNPDGLIYHVPNNISSQAITDYKHAVSAAIWSDLNSDLPEDAQEIMQRLGSTSSKFAVPAFSHAGDLLSEEFRATHPDAFDPEHGVSEIRKEFGRQRLELQHARNRNEFDQDEYARRIMDLGSQERDALFAYNEQTRSFTRAFEFADRDPVVRFDRLMAWKYPGYVPYADSSAIIAQWAYSSNDHDLRSLGVQKAVADEFGLELHPFQQERITEVSSDRDAYLSDFPGPGRDVYWRDFSKEDLMHPFEISGTLELRRTPEEAERLTRKFVRGVYQRTQDEIKSMQWPQKVRVFRGIEDVPAELSVSQIVDLTQNPLESWSVAQWVARGFAGVRAPTNSGMSNVMLAMDVDTRRIFSMPMSGIGCLDEGEVVLLGSVPNKDFATVVYAKANSSKAMGTTSLYVSNTERNEDWIKFVDPLATKIDRVASNLISGVEDSDSKAYDPAQPRHPKGDPYPDYTEALRAQRVYGATIIAEDVAEYIAKYPKWDLVEDDGGDSKAYDPTQPRDPKGRWTTTGSTRFHATFENNVDSIKQNGIYLDSGGNGNRPPSVYFMTSKSDAIRFGTERFAMDSRAHDFDATEYHFAVVEFALPSEDTSVPDESKPTIRNFPSARRIEQAVPPESIQAIYIYKAILDPDNFGVVSEHRLVATKSDGPKGYYVIFEDFREVAKAYDPSQPRHPKGTAQGGQFKPKDGSSDMERTESIDDILRKYLTSENPALMGLYKDAIEDGVLDLEAVEQWVRDNRGDLVTGGTDEENEQIFRIFANRRIRQVLNEANYAGKQPLEAPFSLDADFAYGPSVFDMGGFPTPQELAASKWERVGYGPAALGYWKVTDPQGRNWFVKRPHSTFWGNSVDEVYAYRLAKSAGLPVVPAHLTTTDDLDQFIGPPDDIDQNLTLRHYYNNYSEGSNYLTVSPWLDEAEYNITDSGTEHIYNMDNDLRSRAILFDYVIRNTDRHSGNVVAHRERGPVLIDHGFTLKDGMGEILGNAFYEHAPFRFQNGPVNKNHLLWVKAWAENLYGGDIPVYLVDAIVQRVNTLETAYQDGMTWEKLAKELQQTGW